MKSTEPRDSNLESLHVSDRKSYKFRSLGIASMVIRPELRKLAQNILRSQSQEIDQMRGWYSNIR